MAKSWHNVRVSFKTHQAILRERANIMAMKELGHYQQIEENDRHGVPMDEVIRFALNELLAHRQRSMESTKAKARRLLDQSEGDNVS